jgi:hypothetical protein
MFAPWAPFFKVRRGRAAHLAAAADFVLLRLVHAFGPHSFSVDQAGNRYDFIAAND